MMPIFMVSMVSKKSLLQVQLQNILKLVEVGVDV